MDTSVTLLKLIGAAIGGFITSILFIYTTMFAPIKTIQERQWEIVNKNTAELAGMEARQQLIMIQLERIEDKIDTLQAGQQ